MSTRCFLPTARHERQWSNSYISIFIRPLSKTCMLHDSIHFYHCSIMLTFWMQRHLHRPPPPVLPPPVRHGFKIHILPDFWNPFLLSEEDQQESDYLAIRSGSEPLCDICIRRKSFPCQKSLSSGPRSASAQHCEVARKKQHNYF